MTKRARVFVINKSFHDFAQAEKFGDLFFMTEGKVRALDYNHNMRLLYEAAKLATPQDHILITSLQVLNLQFGWALGLLRKQLNILYFDAKTQDYHSFTLKPNDFERSHL